jgi:hypothetical protein
VFWLSDLQNLQESQNAASEVGWMIGKLILSAFVELVFEDVPLIAFVI